MNLLLSKPEDNPDLIQPRDILNDVKMRLNEKYQPLGIKFRMFGWYEDKILVNYRLEISLPNLRQKKDILVIKHAIDIPYPVWLNNEKLLEVKVCDNPQEFWDALTLAMQDGKYIEETITNLSSPWN